MSESSQRVSDTSAEAEAVQLEMFRQAPAWRKLQLLEQLNQSVKLLALSGLRNRRPDATEDELHRALADLILGQELAYRVYGKPVAGG